MGDKNLILKNLGFGEKRAKYKNINDVEDELHFQDKIA